MRCFVARPPGVAAKAGPVGAVGRLGGFIGDLRHPAHAPHHPEASSLQSEDLRFSEAFSGVCLPSYVSSEVCCVGSARGTVRVRNSIFPGGLLGAVRPFAPYGPYKRALPEPRGTW
jgi:hypothetical protein